MFFIYLRTNSDLWHLQHKLIGFYNRYEKCLQRGTDWVFKYSGLRLGFKWLNLFIVFCAVSAQYFVSRKKKQKLNSEIPMVIAGCLSVDCGDISWTDVV